MSVSGLIERHLGYDDIKFILECVHDVGNMYSCEEYKALINTTLEHLIGGKWFSHILIYGHVFDCESD